MKARSIAEIQPGLPSLKELAQIPGVGPSIAQDLLDLGINRAQDLRTKNPEKLYQQLCQIRGQSIDRCMLYVFRCAVYFATTKSPESDRLQWWRWKD